MQTQERTKYGQCWVYSAVTVTFCRALGLACRSVTNKSSAHDHGANLEIDWYRDESIRSNDFLKEHDGPVYKDEEDVSHNLHDMVWNFHVWNNVWFSWNGSGMEEDFEIDVDGWNAIDATPQEESDGLVQCGPAPLKAILSGRIEGHGFDAKFVFSEVNADVVTWKVEDKQVTESIYRDRHLVGKKMWTARGDDPEQIEDIMAEYKPEEGTEEAETLYNYAKDLGLYRYGDDEIEDSKDSSLKVEIDSETFDDKLGDDMTFEFKITHDADRMFTYAWKVEKVDCLDRGTVTEEDVLADGVLVEEPDSEETVVSCTVPASVYFPHLQGKNLGFKLTAVAFYSDEEGNSVDKIVQSSETFTLGIAHEMIGDIDYEYREDGSGIIVIKGVFQNTVGFDLTNVAAEVQGEAMSTERVDLGDLGAGDELEFEVELAFRKPGNRRFNITMDTDEVPDIIKHYQLEVKAEFLNGTW